MTKKTTQDNIGFTEEDEMNQFYCNDCMGEEECEDSCMCVHCVETNGFKHLQVYGYD